MGRGKVGKGRDGELAQQLVIRQTGVSRRTGELVAIKTYKLKSLRVYC